MRNGQRLGAGAMAALAAPLALAGTSAGPGQPAGLRGGQRAAACTGWAGAPVPGPGTGSASLDGVTVLSRHEAWAVGSQHASGQRTLTEHWNGSTWKQVASPSPGSGRGVLNAVSALSPTSVWAAGSYASGAAGKTLILHWDGTTWHRVPAPSPGGSRGEAELTGVRAVSASDVWAVGDYATGPTSSYRTLILHWDGTAWSRVPSPAGAVSGTLAGVTMISLTNGWAAGSGASRHRPLVLHWNGRSWQRSATPPVGLEPELTGVAASSADSAWAVGDTLNGTVIVTVTLHWDGKTWHRVTSPSPGGVQGTGLAGVAATPSGTVWAAGDAAGLRPGDRPLVLHRTGSRWTGVRVPSTGREGVLNAVAATTSGYTWAVGSFESNGTVHPLAAHSC
jgi:hypothetical protein